MRGGGLEIGHREKRVRGSLEPDELHALGWRTGLVELDVAQAPLRQRLEGDARSEVAPFGERDRVARPEQGEHEGGCRSATRRKEQRVAAVELAEAGFGLGDRRAAVAGVVELPR